MITQEKYRTAVKELLASGTVKMVIGYKPGSTSDRRRPLFIRTSEEADQLVLDSLCVTNLSGYLVAEGLLSDEKKVGIFLRPEGIRSINILAAESQLNADQVVILGFDSIDRAVSPLQGRHASDFSDLIGDSKEHPRQIPEEPLLERIGKMDTRERFDFWQEEFSRCIKCYACRQACPMCYCRRCIVDNNQPQWINTSSHTLGNFEWNIVRAFHLAGRCVQCGNCDRACPVNIPLRLINQRMAKEVMEEFDHFAGLSQTQEPVLASFKKDDTETFIL
ncbi:4Fe-4S dicluster domain-containing protein [Pelodictyon phaeoclathratiforme]|jgi:ferredoxin|uniref:4Fe-4S ferredoxin iron-sulfur binding domain protein n=1 Tax=Pelodictyon phaeoclathratiforme (strain DSM 5477 / BU-1) TaxID=324925 RepID=B4SHA2_PELPB|nr:4Fe-4S dicluster domain-containing protein [Pelodictyon phaeoclathratiforme]ACF43569.1 4Fe-4S ferredoxin iron-sulfur binding domain protein [Pelodictyon phaeoclathratiforme BU-1]MBV5289133.1 4Fe-4S dicluster domain-containing protein [Pelodictyon phaeoclathratiforme]